MLRSGDRNDYADGSHIVKSFSLHLTGRSRAFFLERVSAYHLTLKVPEIGSQVAKNGLKLKPTKQERLGDGHVTVSAKLTGPRVMTFESCSRVHPLPHYTDAWGRFADRLHFYLGAARSRACRDHGCTAFGSIPDTQLTLTGKPLNDAQIAKGADYLCLASTVPSDAQAAFLGVFQTPTDYR